MKKNSKLQQILAMAGAGVLMMGCLSACGGGADNADSIGAAGSGNTSAESRIEDTDLSGSIQIVGSTSMEKLSNALREVFMEKYPDVAINAEFVGSGAGIEAVNNGTADIGNSSRNLKDEEMAAGAVENVVAIDGIAVCVDPSNTVDGLERQ